jgi:hypothetical protein
VNARRLRPPAALAVVAIAAIGLTGCNSAPSAKRVALDTIETLDISDAAKDCMTLKVEEYPEEDLDQIAELAAEGNAEGVADLARFEQDLASCTSPG